jgi:hypothetical protein
MNGINRIVLIPSIQFISSNPYCGGGMRADARWGDSYAEQRGLTPETLQSMLDEQLLRLWDEARRDYRDEQDEIEFKPG